MRGTWYFHTIINIKEDDFGCDGSCRSITSMQVLCKYCENIRTGIKGPKIKTNKNKKSTNK